MITYSCPHNGIIEAIEAAGYELFSENRQYSSSNDVAVQSIIDNFDHLAYVINLKKREIDEELELRVNDGMQPVEQRMQLFRASLVLENRANSNAMNAVQSQRSDKATSRQLLLQALFDAADTARYALELETDWTIVFAFDAKTDVVWP